MQESGKEWTGLSSPSERRKIQNRVHQRAWRRRRALQRSGQSVVYQSRVTIQAGDTREKTLLPDITPTKLPCHLDGKLPCPPENNSLTVKVNDTITLHPAKSFTRDPNFVLPKAFDSVAGLSCFPTSEWAQITNAFSRGNLNESMIQISLQEWALNRSPLGCPRSDSLMVLVKINFFRCLVSNSQSLGILPTVLMDDEATSQFNQRPIEVDTVLKLPPALRPTELQTQLVHHPWIDCLPIPQLRQNLIQAGDSFDDMELCGDLVGLFSAGTGSNGLIVWGEPWDPTGFEVTEGFLRYWGWTVKGCWELFDSTNTWRAKRGEPALNFNKFGFGEK